jgi:uncharacterized protein YodC (DUF2158 family)
MANKNFKIGDQVTHKSNFTGPVLIVIDIDGYRDDLYHCRYWSEVKGEFITVHLYSCELDLYLSQVE